MYSITLNDPFVLENGEVLNQLTIGFHLFGRINPERNNVVWVNHALTADSNVFDWWSGLFGKEKLFNPEQHFIVCVNSLGSCYGTTGPTTPESNKRPLLEKFPSFTTRDMARVYDKLREILQIEQISLLIGASIGGQQAMEWSIEFPERIKRLVLIATNARHSAYGIAFNESQRLAILADPTYGNDNIDGGRLGLIAARSIAMLSYRSYDGYVKTQTNPGNHKVDDFLASSYQQYQGVKLANRFNAYSYVALLNAMDSHNVGRNRESIESALNSISARTLVVGIDSDQLFPPSEQEFLSDNINGSIFTTISSDFGHDGFLIETEKLGKILKDFLSGDTSKYVLTNFKSNELIAQKKWITN